MSPKKNVTKLAKEADDNSFYISEEDIIKLEKDEEFIQEAKERGIPVRQVVEEMFDVKESMKTNSNENNSVYNAKEDALAIFAKGCKYGVFNIVFFENAKEISNRRDLRLDLFIHKFLLNMPREDFADFYVRPDDVNLDALSVLYSNGVTKQKFRPYVISRRS